MSKLKQLMEKFSKAMVQPLSYLSVAGMILVIGVLITNNSITGVLPFLKWQPLQIFGKFLYECVMVIINNLGLVFTVGIAAALAKRDKHQAAIIALLSYLMFLTANNVILKEMGMLAEANPMLGLYGSGQATVLGIQVTDMGVFSGIILGCLCGYVFNKTCQKSFRGYWSMYSGTRFSFACMLLVSILFGLGCAYVWPFVQQGIGFLTGIIAKSGEFGLFLYGMLERLLIPTGLHHLVYAPFQFGDLGGTINVGGQNIVGAYPILLTELQMGVPLSDSIYYMGTGLAKTFGYLGICAAFYYTAKPENKAKTKNILIPLALTASLSGITEPIDFMFAFVSPLLFLVHSMIAGVFLALLKVFNIHAMTTGLINSFLMNLAAGVENTGYPLMYLLALVEIVVYFFVFVFMIKKLNLRTPGREDSVEVETEVKNEASKSMNNGGITERQDDISKIIEGLGGKDNIVEVENCFTRLRVNVKNVDLLNEALINEVENSGIVKKEQDIQIIFGLRVPEICAQVREKLEK